MLGAARFERYFTMDEEDVDKADYERQLRLFWACSQEMNWLVSFTQRANSGSRELREPSVTSAVT